MKRMMRPLEISRAVMLLFSGIAVAVLSLVPRSIWAEEAIQSVASNDGYRITFYVLAVLVAMCAGATVLLRNPVIAALFLILTLLFTGGIFLVLHAAFLAAIQILVYAGAVMVLFIFVVMSVPYPEREDFTTAQGPVTITIRLAIAVSLLVGLGRLLWLSLDAFKLVGAPIVDESFGDVTSIGRLLFSDYLYPFEAVSLLLLVAIVGAVMVSRHASKTGGQ